MEAEEEVATERSYPPPEPPNEVSLFGGPSLGVGRWAASAAVGTYALWKMWRGSWLVRFPRGAALKPDWGIIRQLFR